MLIKLFGMWGVGDHFTQVSSRFVFCICFCLALEAGAAGVVDSSFNPLTAIGTGQIKGMRVMADGKTLVAGSGFYKRLNVDGSDDESYAPGSITSSFGADAAAITSDGKIIIGGRPLTINGTSYGNVVRVLAGGAIDPGFASPNFGTSPRFRQIKVDEWNPINNNPEFIYLNGSFRTVDGQSVSRLARLLDDGTLDPSFVSEKGVSFNSFIDLFSTKELLLATTDFPESEIVKLSDGGTVPWFATWISSQLSGVSIVQVAPGDLSYFASSSFSGTTVLSNSVTRLHPDGVVDRGFEPREVVADGVSGEAYRSIATDRFGRVYLGGGFHKYDGFPRTNLVRIFPDGSIDDTFDVQGDGSVYQIDVAPDGKLLVGGLFTTLNGTAVNQPARLLVNDLSESPAFQLVSTNHHQFDNIDEVRLNVMRTGPTNLAASVEFSITPGSAVAGVDYIDQSGTLDFAPGEDVKTISISVPLTTDITSARDFYVQLTGPSAGTPVNERASSRVTLLEHSSEVSFALGSTSIRESAGVGFLEVRRTAAESVTGLRLAGNDVTAEQGIHYEIDDPIVRFKEGETVKSVQLNIFDDAVENEDRVFGVGIMDNFWGAVGEFNDTSVLLRDDDVDGMPGRGFNWSGTSAQGVNVLFADSQGRTLAGGGFVQVNGMPLTNLVRLMPSGDVDPSFVPGSGPDREVFTIAEDSDGRILIGGHFTSYDGSPSSKIARLNSDGSLDETFDVGFGFDALVERIEVLADGRILVGGFFSSFAGTTRKGVAMLNPDGSVDESFVPATNDLFRFMGHGAFNSPNGIYAIGEGEFGDPEGTNIVLRLTSTGERDLSFEAKLTDFRSSVSGLVVQPDGKLIVGGIFDFVDGLPRTNIARLNPDGSADESFDPGVGTDAWVFRVVRQNDGKLVIVGHFTHYDNTPRQYVARINIDGSLDEGFDHAADLDSNLNAVALVSDGSIQVGGRIRSVDGIQRTGIAAFKTDGKLSLATPQFRFVERLGVDVVMSIDVEPDIEVRLLESVSMESWSPVSTNRTSKRLMEFSRDTTQGGAGFYQAEMLVP